MRRRRWPAAIFEDGTEPDPRFSLANERTFLAWVRTSLGLTAAGVALDALGRGLSDGARTAIGTTLVLLGLLTGTFAFVRWALNERSLRRGEPLPGFSIGAIVTVGLLIIGAIVAFELLR
ncbi:DUF202 domain-containing protein [Nocardioides panacisoli]|uniref:YidH family protein n=1 Tax=Nocardioides panacisoli TaxID=627624 RepID=UPI001C6396C3|nr:DUF202 domain-containing protein [Nocardioides panacisoli]QYJ04431.1 DUF202 domain-containing protein [Nocardioides panacisoli]